MVFRALWYNGTLNLNVLSGKLDSSYFFRVLENGLNAQAIALLGDLWTWMEDNSSVHKRIHQ